MATTGPDGIEPVPAAGFLDYAEPERVKLVWTLETEPLGPSRSRLRTETRVRATDEAARRKFRRYWRLAGIGILLIRRLALSGIRREAERTAREGRISP